MSKDAKLRWFEIDDTWDGKADTMEGWTCFLDKICFKQSENTYYCADENTEGSYITVYERYAVMKCNGKDTLFTNRLWLLRVVSYRIHFVTFNGQARILYVPRFYGKTPIVDTLLLVCGMVPLNTVFCYTNDVDGFMLSRVQRAYGPDQFAKQPIPPDM